MYYDNTTFVRQCGSFLSTHKFLGAFSKNAKRNNPNVHQQVDRYTLRYIHLMKYYLAIRIIHTKPWINFKTIVLSESHKIVHTI